jgi:leader peptidase (prepilin peptidase)/N-methyltransferase
MFSGVVYGALLAGIVIVVLLVLRRITLKTYIPFGPFLIIGALWAILVLE